MLSIAHMFRIVWIVEMSQECINSLYMHSISA
jgi:hypothetical protein